MNITFEKWHGNGNDFVIVNSIHDEIKIKKSFVKNFMAGVFLKKINLKEDSIK